ncbi:hypothetical protein SAMN02745181_2512 [Rubritalea squalenifaciens DSM 18772]|uniref:Uncharacterized protein n=1 Tax=Rubritalea squalenifaciens DSM 18772 TaxID=1123071 RepID=A0A1M6LV79_9BACT|nr:hypothetical protein [Rubritalea squalenifaciens]SHJ75023.1 hypothetical protein SAMN02745181_2512 [Rubritalea squalenifaciens DSM 18772]
MFPRKKIVEPKGFALVATLSVTVLIMLLAMGMLSLSNQESRIARDPMVEAQANARMALMIAIGELQEAAGPDQRITANSNILGSGVQREYLLGTWRSIGDGVDKTDVTDLANDYRDSYSGKDRNGRFLKWLVSGEKKDVEEIDFVKVESTNNEVALIGRGSLGLAPDASVSGELERKIVSVPKVQITQDYRKGAYAWMVSGESLKARIDFERSEKDDRSTQLVAKAAHPNTSLEAFDGQGAPALAGKFVTTEGELTEKFGKTHSWKTLKLAAEQEVEDGDIGYYYHDLSTKSVGVLTNVKWGGLRKDLNMMMEREALPQEMQLSPDIAARVFEDGPFWYDLRNYMRAYKPLSEGGLLTWDGDQPTYSLGNDWLDVCSRRGWQHRMPVVSKWLWLVSYFGDPVSADKSQLCMVVQPIIELWNPFNIQLSLPPDSHFDLKFWSMPLALNVRQPGVGNLIQNRALHHPVRENESYDSSQPQIAAPTVRYEVNLKDQFGKPKSMAPGEVVLYSDGSNRPKLPSSRVIPLNRGFEVRGGTYSANIDHYGNKLVLDSNAAIEVYYTRRNEWFYSDNYLVGPQGYPNQWSYQADIMTVGSMRATSVDLDPNKSLFSLSSTSKEDPQPSVLVGAVLKTEHSIADISLGDELTLSEQVDFSPFLFSPLTLGQCFIRENNEHQLTTSPYNFIVRRVNDFDDIKLAIDGDNGHLGRSVGVDGQSMVPVREIPVQPITSMAQLQHSDLGHYAARYEHNPKDPSQICDLSDDYGTYKLKPWHLKSHPNINYAFANSFANPFVSQTDVEHKGASPLGGFHGGDNGYSVTLHDKSWKLNEALWDDWYTSGLGNWDSPLVEDKKSMSQLLEELSQGKNSLPNMRYHVDVIDAEKAKLELEGDDGYKKLAQYLTIKGSFNVNSTSKHAWKALLSGLNYKGNTVAFLNAQNGEWETESLDNGFAFSRFTLANGSSVEASGGGQSYWQKRWFGSRKLTSSEIDALAEAIVKQVKARGPFLSLGEFMNRRLVDGEDGLCGALQAAIDESGINKDCEADSKLYDEDSVAGSFQNKKALANPKGMTGKAAPGFLTQADILMGIAPALSARCDTFTVRAYGEAHDLSGKIVARAWCEATVQRVPEFVDAADEPVNQVSSSLNPINQKLGRKMRMISFRWLAEDEV